MKKIRFTVGKPEYFPLVNEKKFILNMKDVVSTTDCPIGGDY